MSNPKPPSDDTPTPTARRDTQALLAFFKALADPNRLRIVGLLAQRRHTVEEIAAALGTSNGTASHHLKRLARAELVTARPEGYYRSYTLREDTLHAMSARLLGADALPHLADDVDVGAFDRKVLKAFVDTDGRITAWPAQRRKYDVLLRYVLQTFAPGRRYAEKEVNAALERFHEDTAMLRRDLVGFGYMDREGGGGAYWVTDRGTHARLHVQPPPMTDGPQATT